MKASRSSFTLHHWAIVEVVKTWLRLQKHESVQIDDFLSIRVPQSEHGCQILLEAISKLEKEIELLITQISKSQDELDTHVANYYGLDATDLEIIADFLRLF